MLLSPPQTGRAGFPHPAYPKTIERRACTESTACRSDGLPAEGLQVGEERLVRGEAVRTLATTAEMTQKAVHGESIELMERNGRIAMIEIPTPASQPGIDLADQVRDRHPATARGRQLTQLVPRSGQSLVRSKHVQIAPVAAVQVAVVAERESQEGQTRVRSVHLHHLGLLPVQREPEAAFEQRFHPLDESRRLEAGQDHEVIRIANELRLGPGRRTVGPMKRLFEPVQVQVRQERRDDSALGCSLLGSSRGGPPLLVGLHDGGREPQANQPQHGAVGNPPLYGFHQGVVGNRVEVPLQIGVIHFPVARGQCFPHGVDRLMGASAWTKPIRTVQEVGLKDRLQYEQHRHLDDPVLDRGNAQRSQPVIRLGYVHPLHRLRLVSLGAQFLLQFLEKLRRARAINDVPAGDAVHSRSAVVLEHQPPSRGQHVEPKHPVIQNVKPEARLLFGLAAQLPPQLRDFHRQLHARLHLRGFRRLVGVRCSQSFRRGLLSQADLLASCGNMSSAGLLGSPVVSRFIATMSPSDFRRGRRAVMCSRSALAANLPDSLPALPDLSGSWRVCRYPPSPTTPESRTVAFARCFTVRAGFALYGRLAALGFISRGRIGFTYVTADSFALRGFVTAGRPVQRPVGCMAYEQLPWSVLSTNKTRQASPDAP